MSIFKNISSAAAGEELIDSGNYSTNANITISQIKVTNHGEDSTIVSVWLEGDGINDMYIFRTDIPPYVTMIFDEPFSYPNSNTLKVTAPGTPALTIVIN